MKVHLLNRVQKCKFDSSGSITGVLGLDLFLWQMISSSRWKCSDWPHLVLVFTLSEFLAAMMSPSMICWEWKSI